ncbi:MAG: outer membrane lipoprotein-sorting protein, partial [Melioribacteraceae bacterium]|nr:outer membrane lipoprotein-sorting protein [Melioribacteraceae bacterium]
KMKKVFSSIIFIIILTSTLIAQDAKEIIAKSDELIKSRSSYAEFSMEIVKTDWTRSFGMKSWALEPDYAIIYVTEPARDKGTVTLKRKKEVWNWIPAAQKVIKIPPSMMLQSWMGSDFTNDDLVKESSVVNDYTHAILSEDVYSGYQCYVIESIPKEDAGVVWGKLLTWISKEYYFAVKTEFYDEDEYLVKKYIGSDIKEMDGRTFPTHWEMLPEDRPGEKTTFTYLKIQFNYPVNESFFAEKNMKRVR